MIANNALVTYTNLTTMGLIVKGSPPTGSRIATKQFVTDNYYVDTGASPFSTYSAYRCPPYQTIIPFYPSTFITLVSSYQIEVSGNNGNTWANKALAFNPEGLYEDISMSGSGQYQTVVDNLGYITYSQNYGFSFTKNIAAGSRRWTCVAVSRYTGQYQIAGVNGGNLANLYRSTNYGTTWSVISGFTGFWNSVAISGNGQYQLSGDSIDGYLYVSSNYGANWTTITSMGKYWWGACAISGNGQYQYAYGYTTSGLTFVTFISSNYGSTWSLLSTGPSIQVAGSPPSIATNETGQYVTIGKDSTMYVSSNYGASFSTIVLSISSNAITAIKMTSSGQEQVVSISASPSYYMSTDYGATWIASTTLTGGYSSIDISDSTSGTTTTTTTTTPPITYDYYLALYYDCVDCGAGPVGTTEVGFLSGSTVSLNRFYQPEGGPDGLAYRITSTTIPTGPIYILTTAFGSTSTCALACSVV